MVEAFKDLKGKSLGYPEKKEQLTEEVQGRGEEVTTKIAGGTIGSTEAVAATPATVYSGEQPLGKPSPHRCPEKEPPGKSQN